MSDDFKLIPFPRLTAQASVGNSTGRLWGDLDALAHAAAKAAQTAAISDLDPNAKFEMVSKLQGVLRETCEVCLFLADTADAPGAIRDQLNAILASLGKR
ncbi:MAG: hypothetical protein FD152_475 [Xanthobacteraceae bacterium]|nr:MAG: hypothetical protein FD152_475 [Xanthobacteraceae bacterium]